MRTRLIAILCFTLIFEVHSNSQTFVKSDAQGSNNGTSWADAYTNLDSAILHANGNEIWVARGTYYPPVPLNIYSNHYKTFFIDKNVKMYGGFNGTETELNDRDPEKNPTILSGNLGDKNDLYDNASRVLSIVGSDVDTTTVIDGFIVSDAVYSHEYETGGIYINWASPVIRNCVIKDNQGFYGGGICVRASNALIINNTICNNTSYEGAGIYANYCDNVRIINNKIFNNRCTGGYSHLSGGGIHITYYCTATITGNLIARNYAGDYGGGIAMESNYEAYIANNIITENESEEGGGIYTEYITILKNNLISKNLAHSYGGGIASDYNPKLVSINNTIVKNTSPNGSAIYLSAVNMDMINTIIYDNSSPESSVSVNIGRSDWFPKISYCDIENGPDGIQLNNTNYMDSIWIEGNISAQPAFSDTANNLYTLKASSPCLNAGTPDTTNLNIGPAGPGR